MGEVFDVLKEHFLTTLQKEYGEDNIRHMAALDSSSDYTIWAEDALIGWMGLSENNDGIQVSISLSNGITLGGNAVYDLANPGSLEMIMESLAKTAKDRI